MPASIVMSGRPGQLLFVYGTLKRGGTNHAWLADQRFVTVARTIPGFTLFALDGYPGLVRSAADSEGVLGELWEISPTRLAELDVFEGVPEGLYRRERIPLAAPHAQVEADAYLYAGDVSRRPQLGSAWP